MTKLPRSLLAVILLFGIAATADAEGPRFQLSVQEAGVPFDFYEDRGDVDFDGFIEAYRAFPWMDQIGQAGDGSEPTLYIDNIAEKTTLWVSILGTRREHGYLVGFIYPREIRSFFGLGPARTTRWLKIYAEEDSCAVEGLFELYIAGETEELERQLAKRMLWAEMESAR